MGSCTEVSLMQNVNYPLAQRARLGALHFAVYAMWFMRASNYDFCEISPKLQFEDSDGRTHFTTLAMCSL